MKVLPLTEVKAKLSEVVDELTETQERVTITRNGRPVAVLVGCDDLEAIEETLEILSDPSLVAELEAGRAALARGEVVGRTEMEALREQLRSATSDSA
ncbi:MAG: type II toxin-antitoxin system Phd/YefM family antitoxin [Acidimicrobiia bacterium]